MAQEDVFKKLVSHCKEYGFVFPSSDIYDGLGAVYDYGQMGVELKNNIKQYWWQSMVQVLVQMKEYNGIRMTLEYTVLDKETGAIRCVGESRHCFLTRDGKPVSLKRNYIEMDRAFREYSEQSQKEE